MLRLVGAAAALLLAACTAARPTPDPSVAGSGSAPVAESPPALALALDLDGAGTDIYVADADGANLTRLTTSGSATSPTWSSDGTRIAFADGGKRSRLFVMNADGSELQPIARRPVLGSEPDWHPSSDEIVFTGPDGVWTATVGRSSGSPLFGGEGGEHPSWAAGGKRVVFVRDREVMIVERTSRPPSLVFRVPKGFSADGVAADPEKDRVAFFQVGGDGDLYYVQFDGDGSGSFLGGTGNHDLDTSWTQDGSIVVAIPDQRHQQGIAVGSVRGADRSATLRGVKGFEGLDWNPTVPDPERAA